MAVGRALAPALAALALLVTGCGSDESTPTVAESPAGAMIEADDSSDLELALDVQRYLLRNCALPGAIQKISKEDEDARISPLYRQALEGMEAMCGQIASIAVDDERVTIRSAIDAGSRDSAGEAFCNLIQGSDVADFTPGHELQSLEGETIKRCPARED